MNENLIAITLLKGLINRVMIWHARLRLKYFEGPRVYPFDIGDAVGVNIGLPGQKLGIVTATEINNQGNIVYTVMSHYGVHTVMGDQLNSTTTTSV